MRSRYEYRQISVALDISVATVCLRHSELRVDCTHFFEPTSPHAAVLRHFVVFLRHFVVLLKHLWSFSKARESYKGKVRLLLAIDNYQEWLG